MSGMGSRGSSLEVRRLRRPGSTGGLGKAERMGAGSGIFKISQILLGLDVDSGRYSL